jgi:hypothetical protein
MKYLFEGFWLGGISVVSFLVTLYLLGGRIVFQ